MDACLGSYFPPFGTETPGSSMDSVAHAALRKAHQDRKSGLSAPVYSSMDSDGFRDSLGHLLQAPDTPTKEDVHM
ncbi:hypothetical protein HaLaN_24332, partial [Haematococcus lacustris]